MILCRERGVDPGCGHSYVRRVLPLLIALTTLPSAFAADAPESGVSAEQMALDEALARYLEGDLSSSRDALLRIVNDPDDPDPTVLREARVWLGEVQYYLGDKEAARSTFRTVLLYERAYRMDPFVHPPEVVAFFDSVRAEVEAAGPTPRRSSALTPPAHAFLWPGGLQWHNGRPGAAALTAVSVTGSVVVVGGLRLYMVNQDQDAATPGINVDTDEEVQQLENMRLAQFGVAAVGTTLWLGTGVGGTVRAVRPTAYPGGVGLTVRW